MQAYLNRPWASVSQCLRSKYHIVAEIDFLEIDYDPQQLFEVLSSLYRPSFGPKEKIIVYHYDFDFYGPVKYGLMIYNFLQAVRSLDISPSVFVLLTSHYGLGKEIQDYWLSHCDQFDYANDGMTVFESNYQQLQAPESVRPTDLDIEKISHAYICLCGQRRVHRLLFLCALADRGILDQGICSWHFNTRFDTLAQQVRLWGKIKSWFLSIGSNDQNKKPKYHFITPSNKTFVNDDWPIDSYFADCFNRHSEIFDHNHRHDLITSTTNQNRFDLPAIKNALLYVAIESAFVNPNVCFTEKTFKAIVMKRPFVIVGCVGSLAKLRELGFRTFDKFWNEDYDQEINPNKRLQKVLDIVSHISSLSVVELQEMCYNMQDILEHNAEHYSEQFAKQQLQQRLQEL
jgi:hypothetical protein